MKKYRVVQVGLGNRGIVHLESFLRNDDRFDVAGICDLVPERVQTAADAHGIDRGKTYSDAERMIADLSPDVLSFATLPVVRLELVELAAKYRVKGLVFEKPMASSIAEAQKILSLSEDAGMKAIICHQHKYLEPFRKLKGCLESGALGEIERIHAETQAQLSQQATHYMDYILWANSGIGAESVIGHVHGRNMLEDTHPSPDYLMGEAVMANGVRANIQCGYFTRPKVAHVDDYENKKFSIEYWTDARLTVYGTTGYAWAECNGRWAEFSARTDGRMIRGDGIGFVEGQGAAQDSYTKDFADWLDDDRRVHPSNLRQAYHGMEILEAMCLSALDNTRVDLPLQLPLKADILKRMEDELPQVARRSFRA